MTDPSAASPAGSVDRAGATDATDACRSARDLLLDLREALDAARARFRWPRPERFNYARDWFDVVAAGPGGGREALVVLGPDGADQRLTFAQLSARSRRL